MEGEEYSLGQRTGQSSVITWGSKSSACRMTGPWTSGGLCTSSEPWLPENTGELPDSELSNASRDNWWHVEELSEDFLSMDENEDSEDLLSREEELQVTGSVAELVSDLLRLSPPMSGGH